MAGYPRSPNVLKGGFVVMDEAGAKVQRVHAFQYNPDSLSRTLAPRGAGSSPGDNAQALRRTGPPAETIALEIEFDATDALERPDRHPETVEHGIAPDLAALESFLTPRVETITATKALADQGLIEVLPAPGELLLLVLGPPRVLPVRITAFAITEEAFDRRLNPIRAKAALSFQVLTSEDLAMTSRAAELFLAHLKRREKLVAGLGTSLAALGLERLA